MHIYTYIHCLWIFLCSLQCFCNCAAYLLYVCMNVFVTVCTFFLFICCNNNANNECTISLLHFSLCQWLRSDWSHRRVVNIICIVHLARFESPRRGRHSNAKQKNKKKIKRNTVNRKKSFLPSSLSRVIVSDWHSQRQPSPRTVTHGHSNHHSHRPHQQSHRHHHTTVSVTVITRLGVARLQRYTRYGGAQSHPLCFYNFPTYFLLIYFSSISRFSLSNQLINTKFYAMQQASFHCSNIK